MLRRANVETLKVIGRNKKAAGFTKYNILAVIIVCFTHFTADFQNIINDINANPI